MIPFAEWTPDVADLGGQGASTASGVFPAQNGYLSWPQAVAYSNACSEKPLGAIMALLSDSTRNMYCGSTQKLFKLNVATLGWDDVSRVSGGSYTLSTASKWDFAQFGSSLIAVNVDDDPQVIDVDSGTKFDALGGSPPRARYIEVVGDFVMFGNLENYPRRVQWCGINNSTQWTVGENQSDYQDFPDGGHLVGMIGGTGGLIFQEEMIRRSSYVGPPAIFQFDKVADRGLIAPYSLVRIGNDVYGISRDGFIKVSMDGQFGLPGAEKVDRWFLNDADPDFMGRIRGVSDRFTTKIYWAYKSTSTTEDRFDSIICFNYALNRWTHARVDCLDIIAAATQGYTLEGLDAIGTIDTIGTSLDDPSWRGGSPVIGIIDADYKLSFFSGSPMEAVIETVEAELFPGKRAYVSGIRPLVDTASTAVRLGHRTLQSGNVSYTSEVATDATTGLAPFEQDNRYVKAKVRIPSGTTWTKALGIDVAAVPAGEV